MDDFNSPSDVVSQTFPRGWAQPLLRFFLHHIRAPLWPDRGIHCRNNLRYFLLEKSLHTALEAERDLLGGGVPLPLFFVLPRHPR